MTTWQDLRDTISNATPTFQAQPELAMPYTLLTAAANAENLTEAKTAIYSLYGQAAKRFRSALVDDAINHLAHTVNDIPLVPNADTESADQDVPEKSLQDLIAEGDADGDKVAASNSRESIFDSMRALGDANLVALSDIKAYTRITKTGKAVMVQAHQNSVLGKWGGPEETGHPALNKFYKGYNTGSDDFGREAAKGLSDNELDAAHDHLVSMVKGGAHQGASPHTDLRTLKSERYARHEDKGAAIAQEVLKKHGDDKYDTAAHTAIVKKIQSLHPKAESMEDPDFGGFGGFNKHAGSEGEKADAKYGGALKALDHHFATRAKKP